MTAPADAFLILPIRLAAAGFKPLRSKVPVTSMINMNIAIFRFAIKLVPSVSSNPMTPKFPTSAVTIAATRMISIASSFNANPIITIRIPDSLISSINLHLDMQPQYKPHLISALRRMIRLWHCIIYILGLLAYFYSEFMNYFLMSSPGRQKFVFPDRLL